MIPARALCMFSNSQSVTVKVTANKTKQLEMPMGPGEWCGWLGVGPGRKPPGPPATPIADRNLSEEISGEASPSNSVPSGGMHPPIGGGIADQSVSERKEKSEPESPRVRGYSEAAIDV